MNTVKLVGVFVENKPGQLARITGVLHEQSVNIRWVNIATSENFGVLRFLVDKGDAASQALRKQGFTVSQIDVLAIEVQDKPGGLHAVAELLSANGVNVENASGFVTSAHRRAILIIETKNFEHACDTLKKHGLHLLTQEELLTL
jgi:hypothetical protein